METSSERDRPPAFWRWASLLAPFLLVLLRRLERSGQQGWGRLSRLLLQGDGSLHRHPTLGCGAEGRLLTE